MGKLVLVRHGQSQWNLENRFTGWVDVPITPLGEEEAHRAGRELKHNGMAIDLAFVSELQRAKQTLKIILDELGRPDLPVKTDKALNERHYGDLQGLDKAETAKKYGDAQVHIWRRSFDVKPPNGESLKDTAERTLPYFHTFILPAVTARQNILVSAHGNSLRAIIMDLEKLSPEGIMTVEIATCRPIYYDIGPQGEVIKKSVSVAA
jgi:2,3-bisphosphoglycerate-dependent phosphoglycerate mutase